MTLKAILNNIAVNTKRIRKQRGLTQFELAQKTRLSISTVAEIEQGKRANISLKTIVNISKALKTRILCDVLTRNILKTGTFNYDQDFEFLYNQVPIKYFERAVVDPDILADMSPKNKLIKVKNQKT